MRRCSDLVVVAVAFSEDMVFIEKASLHVEPCVCSAWLRHLCLEEPMPRPVGAGLRPAGQLGWAGLEGAEAGKQRLSITAKHRHQI